jgi:hypothetical protein
VGSGFAGQQHGNLVSIDREPEAAFQKKWILQESKK